MPALAAGPDRDLVLWHPHSYIYDRFDRHDVLARAFDATSSIDDGVAATLVTAGVTTQRMLRQALGPNGSFAVWSEMGEDNVVRGRFIPASSNGGDAVTLFDAEGVPSVAASADTFLVAVREYVRKPPYNTRLMLRRFDRNGVALDAQPVVFSNGYLNYGNAISILPDGDSFVLAWSYNTSAFALRVSSRGAIASTPVRITTTKNVAEPHLARVAGRAVVVWISMTPDSGSFTIQGARLRDTLELEPPSDLWLMYTRANAGQGVLSVEGNDRELMVGAGSSPFGETRDCVRVRRFSPDLRPLEEPSLLGCTFAAPVYNTSNAVPRVAWDGERWWALYASGAYAIGTIPLFPFDGNGKPQAPLTLGDFAGHIDVSLAPAPLGVTMLYSHPDEDVEDVMRAFQLPLIAQQPKSRAARH
jgi:hypothetical protein